ncbi:hypothetical protein PHMEG_00041719 [Phytophthora megakarya]|uniref:Uncharacterized protein n=1 Tax=Phytophthora megakarya TaxID=4795 RepID=A0A225UAW9_9STRA|nr:hypothetical protein PHMEG_00041719 [Phytophthora megakarya]
MKTVTFLLPGEEKKRSKAQKNAKRREESSNIYVVRSNRSSQRERRSGLCELNKSQEWERVVPEGKRVICSISGMEALSDGYIDCCPSEMLADTGAIASLVSVNVLKRIVCPGHAIRVHGVIDLPIRLGSLEKMLSFVMVDRLHVDAILGTDILTAFRAVIYLEERTMILKETGETLALGTTRVEESYDASIASTTRLLPGHQALVVSYVRGAVASDSVVLVEGVPGADECLRVARSLCTVHNGQVIVECIY